MVDLTLRGSSGSETVLGDRKVTSLIQSSPARVGAELSLGKAEPLTAPGEQEVGALHGFLHHRCVNG